MIALCLSVLESLSGWPQEVPRNSEFACFFILLQTLSQMVKFDPTTLKNRLID